MKKFLFLFIIVALSAFTLGACAAPTEPVPPVEPVFDPGAKPVILNENLPQTPNDKSEGEIEKTFGNPQALKGKSEKEIRKKFGSPKALLIMNAVKPENSRALYIYYIISQKDPTALYIYLKGNSVIYAEYNEYNGYVSSDMFDVFMEDNKSLPK